MRIAALAAVILLYGGHLVADESAAAPLGEILVLTNGDRVLGTSVTVADGTLVWRMPYGKDLDIPLELVDRIETVPAGPLEAPPTDAPAPESPPAEATPAVVEPPAVPPVVEEKPPEPAPAAEPEKKEEEPKPEPNLLLAAAQQFVPVLDEPLPLTVAWVEAARSSYTFLSEQTGQWTKRIEMGGTWVDGNSESSEAFIGGAFERQFEHLSHQIDWNGRHATAGQNVVTVSRWQINGTTDFSRKSDSKWIMFLTHRHLFDELADLDYRGTFAGGIGYRFINEGDKRFIVRLGPGGTVEKYGDPIGVRVTQDLFAESEAKWPIFDRTLFEYKSTFTPSMEDTTIFRVTSNYGLLVRLDKGERWAARFGLRHDHNSEPNPGTKKNDFTTTFTLVYTRK